MRLVLPRAELARARDSLAPEPGRYLDSSRARQYRPRAVGLADRVPRILIVDDDAPLRRALVRILRPADVVPVTCAAEALRALSEGQFDVILTDYGIEPTDGVRLLGEAARSHPAPRRYLMSGFEESRFDEHVASGLIHRVFPKPLDLAALRTELRCNEPSPS